MPYDVNSEIGQVRLLINDVDDADPIFNDSEIQVFLALEDSVKLAAAQAIDTIADNEALCSKAIRTQDLATDGAKIADSLRKRAQALRDQHDKSTEDDGYFAVIEQNDGFDPDLIGWL